jgi:hypothetical protein
LQVGDTGPVESARRSNSRVLGSPFSGLSGQFFGCSLNLFFGCSFSASVFRTAAKYGSGIAI